MTRWKPPALYYNKIKCFSAFLYKLVLRRARNFPVALRWKFSSLMTAGFCKIDILSNLFGLVKCYIEI